MIDLGYGTGSLAVSFAAAGLTAVGIDPSETMIDYARQRPSADGVTWVVGDSRTLPVIDAEFAVMTGNVAQHIPDGDWQRTLADLHHALRAGGILAFRSRNPAAGAWHTWSTSERSVRETASGPLEEWSEAEEITPGVVRLVAHNAFVGTGELLTYTNSSRTQRTCSSGS
ncbi:class I SAM-dependent methyltransferase [Curtobacterium sp. NPDC090217]|uniref:class I SAM-dependent methyltransferase n=1 Tax=Curtobacterium sp. NPDC090217 TaxID=3363970 RepID=UPI0038075B71